MDNLQIKITILGALVAWVWFGLNWFKSTPWPNNLFYKIVWLVLMGPSIPVVILKKIHDKLLSWGARINKRK